MSKVMRGALAVALIAAWVGTSLHIGGRGIPYPRGLAALVDLSWVITPVGYGALTLVYVAAVIANAARFRPVLTCAVAFLTMALVHHVDQCQYPNSGEHHGRLLPIDVFVAATVGLWWGGERVAREAASGAVAACYTLAGVVKLWRTGPMWAWTLDLPLLSAERAIGAPWPLSDIRMAVAHVPTLGVAGGLLVHAIELGGVLFLWPRLRRPYAIAMITAHLSIGVLLGYSYPDWILVLVAMGLLAPAPEPAHGSEVRIPSSSAMRT